MTLQGIEDPGQMQAYVTPFCGVKALASPSCCGYWGKDCISEFLKTDVLWNEHQNVSDADCDFFIAGIGFSLNFISIAG